MAFPLLPREDEFSERLPIPSGRFAIMVRKCAAVLSAVLAMGAVASAQIANPQPGYVVIRVNMAAVTEGQLAAPGGDGQVPGGPGGVPQPGGGQPGGAGAPATAPFDPTRSVVVVVPYKQIKDRLLYEKFRFDPVRNPAMKAVLSDQGTAILYTDKSFVQLYPLTPGFYLPAILKKRFNAWELTHQPQQGLDLVSDALAYGMVDDAFKIADKLSTAVKAWKTPVPETVTRFVAAYDLLKPKLADAAPDPGDAGRWQTLLGAAAAEQGAHYTLVHWGDQSVSRESTDRKLKLLESNYKAFYLWHALSGQTLKVPAKKLTVVLADKSTDMPRLRDALDGNAMTSDAFYSPYHNVLVMSPERLDETGRSFGKFAQTRYQSGWNRDDLLSGKFPELKGTETGADIAQISTLALVDKLVDEEAAVSMISREANRQLYSSSGVLPQYVILPEWIDSGIGSLLHKPKGPAYTTQGNRTVMTVGLAAGYGAPNYVLVRQLRELAATRELNPSPEVLLMNTLQDKYFEALRSGRDIDPKPVAAGDGGIEIGGPGGQPGGGPQPGGPGPGGPGPNGPGGQDGGGFQPPGGGQPAGDPQAEARRMRERLNTKAQVTSWALTFYLAKKKMPAMLAFFAELDTMPRDLRLDPNQLVKMFCVKFQLMDAIDPTKIDQAAFKRFAQDWIEFMKLYSSWGIDIPIDQSNVDPNQGIGGGNFNQPPGAGGGGGPAVSGPGGGRGGS